jgi:hypothetical protein
MVTTQGGQLSLTWSGIQSSLFLGVNTYKYTAVFNFQQTYVQGGFNNMASLLANASTSPLVYDLTNMANDNPLVTPVIFTVVNGILIQNNDAVNNIIIAPGASNPFAWSLGGTSPTDTIKPGDARVWFSAAGWTVNSGAKTFSVTASGGTPQFHIEIFGN